ncbi:hypothetical protein [Streptomyces sp. URMC 125]|uniref:hypothetical protein n=1 Tax=Streptomyces sp. URMC 125 TaxID=3423419 RepID=UPI003F1A266B
MPVAASMELQASAYEQYGNRLLACVADRLPAYHWHLIERLAQDVWDHALAHADLTADDIEAETELPVWLAVAARTVIRRHLTPTVPEDDTRQAVAELADDDGHASAVPAALAA